MTAFAHDLYGRSYTVSEFDRIMNPPSPDDEPAECHWCDRPLDDCAGDMCEDALAEYAAEYGESI